MTASTATVGASTVSTVTFKAAEMVVLSYVAIVFAAVAAVAWLVVVNTETTRTLAAVTVSEMSAGSTPPRSDAMLFLNAV